MKINKIHLKNIRSYEEAGIELPEGSLLLSGNIGSGKTSVLLAIEFALFGLQRGSLSGNSLLRTGKTHGFVEIEFEISGKKIVIKRSLKRSKNAVAQDTGFISINNEKQELSPVELKQRVLELLNYPKEFLTKTNLLYRYTLYTQQEAMREILTENPDTRLDTLRKVFGIDKYKRITENIERFSTVLREGIKKKEGQMLGINEKIVERDRKKEEMDMLKKEILIISNELEKSQADMKEKKSLLEKKEKSIKKFNEISSEIKTKESETHLISQALSDIEDEKKQLSSDIHEFERQTGNLKLDATLAENISSIGIMIGKIEDDLLSSREKESSLKTKKSEREGVVDNVKQLNICPICKQKVTDEHRTQLNKHLSIEINALTDNIQELEQKSRKIRETLAEAKEKLRLLQEKEHGQQILKLNIERLEEKKKQFDKITKQGKELEDKSQKLKKELTGLKEKFQSIGDIEKEYEQLKEDVEKASDVERSIAIRKTGLDREEQNIARFICLLDREIEQKEKAKSDLFYLAELRDWLKIKFASLLAAIEKEVMARVHSDFSFLLKKWFSMLVTGLDVRLDEGFTPIIESGGYELEYAFLSGGERTAAALAYRLALNQVINSMISRIQTHDIIILDEPTDGFSSEQLDKMREVLAELNVKQLILVSHEEKIEGFVDNIIRFKKESGRTMIEKQAVSCMK